MLRHSRIQLFLRISPLIELVKLLRHFKIWVNNNFGWDIFIISPNKMRFKWLSVEKDKSHTDSCEDLNSLKMMNDMLRYYYCCCMKMIEAKLVCKVVAIEEDQRRGYRGPNAHLAILHRALASSTSCSEMCASSMVLMNYCFYSNGGGGWQSIQQPQLEETSNLSIDPDPELVTDCWLLNCHSHFSPFGKWDQTCLSQHDHQLMRELMLVDLGICRQTFAT